MPKKMRKNFRWRYQPRDQMDMLMLEYMDSCDVRSKTEMMLLALRAFWLPLAIANSTHIEQTTKERIATEACCTLLNQLNQIYASFGLSLPKYLQVNNSVDSTHPPKSTQNSPDIEEQKRAIGEFNYELDSFTNW